MLTHYETLLIGELTPLGARLAREAFSDAAFIDTGKTRHSPENPEGSTLATNGSAGDLRVMEITRDVANNITCSELWLVDLVGDTRDVNRSIAAFLHAVDLLGVGGRSFEINVLAPDHVCRRVTEALAEKEMTARCHRLPDVVMHLDMPLSPTGVIAEIARQVLLASMISAGSKTAMTLSIPKDKALGCCTTAHLVKAVRLSREATERVNTRVAPQVMLTVGDFVFLSCVSSPFLPVSLSPPPGHVHTPIEKIFSNNISRACLQLNDDQAPVEADRGLTPALRNKLTELVQTISQAMASPKEARVFDRVEVESWDGHRLNVYTAGDPANRPLLLVNAYGMPIDFMAPLAEALRDRFYLVSWESRGIPSIWPVAGTYDFGPGAHVRDAFHISDLLSLEKPDVIGWCTGGHIALKMALSNSDRIGKLVLLNGGYNFDNIPDTAFQKNMRHVMLAAAQNIALAKLYHRALYVRSDSHPSGSALDASSRTTAIFDSTDTSLVHLTGLPYQSPENLFRYASLIASFVKDNDYSGIDSLDTRTLIITAKNDHTTGYLGSVYVSNRLRHSQIRFHPNGDHFLLYKEVDYLVSQLEAFLQ